MSTNSRSKIINYQLRIPSWRVKWPSAFSMKYNGLRTYVLYSRLLTQFSRLKEVEARLELITVEQGTNVNELVALVKENQEILDKQTRVVRGETVQALMGAIVSSQDTDPKITDREINKVMLKLAHLPAIEVDEEGIRKLMIGKELSIKGVFKMIKEMEDLPEENQVIHFK